MSKLDKYDKKLDINVNRPYTNEEAIIEYYRLSRKGLDFKLTERQDMIRILCEKCLTYILDEKPRDLIRDLLLKDSQYTIKPNYVFTIINMTHLLFGNAEKTPIEIQRQIAIKNFKRIQQKAETDGDYKAAALCQDRISKIQGLYNKDEEKIRDLPPIRLSSDPKILEQVYTDIDYEDVKEEFETPNEETE